MDDDECFICGDGVCDKELLESMDITSIKDLSKSLSNLISVPPVAAVTTKTCLIQTDEMENAPLCYKCINRVLDAHNLYNQINLLQIKLKVIQFDVHSLMKKTEKAAAEDFAKRKVRGRTKLTRTLSKFQQLRKNVVEGLASSTRTEKGKSKTKLAGASSSSLKRTVSKDPICEADIKNDIETSDADLDVNNEDDSHNFQETTNPVIAEVNDCEVDLGDRESLKKNKTDTSRRKLLAKKVTERKPSPSQRISSRVRVRTKKYADFSSPMNDPEPSMLVDSSDDDEDLFVPDLSDDQETEEDMKSENQRKYEPGEDPLALKLTCPHSRCNTVYFKNDFSLQAHIKRIHEGNKKPFECETCGKAFQYPTYLREHRLSHIGEDNFPCSHCNKILKSAKSRRVHEKTHRANGKPFACNQCDKSFANKQHLQSHQISHQTDTIFTCDICGKTFMRQRSLELHNRIHDEPDRAHCTTCNKMFSTDTALKIHKELHVRRSKPRVCPLCPFECYTRKDIRQHVKVVHTTEHTSTHTCEICGRQLRTKKSLESHLRTHSLEKPFNCSICGKAFGDVNCRRRHENLHFKQTFMCEICGKSFAAQCYLAQHLKTHEKEKLKAEKDVPEQILVSTEEEIDDNDPDPECSIEEAGEVKTIDMDLEIMEGREEEQSDEETQEILVDNDNIEEVQADEERTITFAEVRGPHGEIQFVEIVAMNE